jgi:hypothetical protein
MGRWSRPDTGQPKGRLRYDEPAVEIDSGGHDVSYDEEEEE